ncbi:MAG: hypothetical protein Kow0068_04030 [Marinilabiliales bacterium]
MAKRGRKKNKSNVKDIEQEKKIKIRLDGRTVITIRNIAMFKIWKEKYPNAEIIT